MVKSKKCSLLILPLSAPALVVCVGSDKGLNSYFKQVTLVSI